MLQAGCNCCPSFSREYKDSHKSPYGARGQVRGIFCPTSTHKSPKTKAHACRKASLFVKAWASITNTKRNREALGCQETPEPSQGNTRHTVLEKVKQRGFRADVQSSTRAHAAGKDANQGHQQAAIPGLAEEQDSGFATKKKFKATLDSVTIFPSYGNNLSWRFIFSRTFASRRIKTGRALISVSFMLLPVYSFSKEVTFYLHSVGIKAEAQKKIKIS